MRTLFRIGFVISATAIVLSGAAMAQAAYDGTYVGVSSTLSGGSRCVTAQTPAPLTIANGTAASTTGFFTGSVDASGHIVLHTKESTRFEGQIDGSGSIKAGGSLGHCTYTIVWKKR